MPKRINYERVSITVRNYRTLDLTYKIKLYLESIYENCVIQNFSLFCDGEKKDNYYFLENFTTINYTIKYLSDESKYGLEFYKQHCLEFSKDELHVFGITHLELPKFYHYDGYQISDLIFEKMTSISHHYQTFEAHPLSVIFQIPESKNQDGFRQLLKSWIEIGSEFYEECSDVGNVDGYISYLVEPDYQVNRSDFINVVDLYNQLIDMTKQLEGRLISVQPLFVSHTPKQDIVLKIEKSNVGIYTSEPFFYPILN